MALPKTIDDRIYKNFIDCDGPTKKVAVCNTGTPVEVEFGEAGSTINSYSEANSVAGSATVTILTYTVPALKELRLKRIEYSGTNRSEFLVDVNSSTIAKQRIYYSGYNGYFGFNDLPFVAGDIIEIIVENKTNSVADFNSNLQGNLRDA